jgi:anti-sigma factor RsiW
MSQEEETRSEVRDCSVIRALLVPFLDGELESDRHQQVAKHLAGCPACCAVTEEHRRLTMLLGELPEAPRVSVALRVQAALRTVRARERRIRWAAWAAAILIVAAGGWFGYWTAPGEPPEPELTENWGVFQEIAALEQVGGEDVAADPEIVHAVYELALETPSEGN